MKLNILFYIWYYTSITQWESALYISDLSQPSFQRHRLERHVVWAIIRFYPAFLAHEAHLSHLSLKLPFPRSINSHFHNETKNKSLWKWVQFICTGMKNHFHINGFALSLALRQRLGSTRKWRRDSITLLGIWSSLYTLLNETMTNMQGSYSTMCN